MSLIALADGWTFLSGAVGALIGTFGGAYLIHWFSQNKVKKVRNLAISALKTFKKYAKKEKTYASVTDAFNNDFNDVQKRAVLVALYKVGIPILIPDDGNIRISTVNFESKRIDAKDLDDMIANINQGLCDKYFYEDIEACVSADLKIKAIRRIGVRFVEEVLSKSSVDGEIINYPSSWFLNFSYGERQTIGVLMKHLTDKYYFEHGVPRKSQMDKIISEINLGIWDNKLLWDHDAYESMIIQKDISKRMLHSLSPSANYVSHSMTGNQEDVSGQKNDKTLS